MRTSSSTSFVCSRGTASRSATTDRRSHGRRRADSTWPRCCRRTRPCCGRWSLPAGLRDHPRRSDLGEDALSRAAPVSRLDPALTLIQLREKEWPSRGSTRCATRCRSWRHPRRTVLLNGDAERALRVGLRRRPLHRAPRWSPPRRPVSRHAVRGVMSHPRAEIERAGRFGPRFRGPRSGAADADASACAASGWDGVRSDRCAGAAPGLCVGRACARRPRHRDRSRRAWSRTAPRRLALARHRALLVARVVALRRLATVGIRRLRARYPIGLRRPRAEVDRLAPLGAKRPPARRRRPFDGLPQRGQGTIFGVITDGMTQARCTEMACRSFD